MQGQRAMLPDSQAGMVIRPSGPPVQTTSPDTLREVAAVLFRNKRALRIAFLATFAGALLGVFLFGISYEADTQIVVKHRRADEVVSTDANTRDQANSNDQPTEREINTEISLLKSGDLLVGIVKKLGLEKRERHFWNVLFPWRDEQWMVANAARKVERGLKITEVPQSNVIKIAYRSGDPELAANILTELDKQYLAKHLAVYRPPGVFDFFHDQTQRYQQELQQAEKQLASYDLDKNSAEPELEKEILVKKSGDFEGAMRETEAAMADTDKRIKQLQEEISHTPERLTTQETSGDNPQLLSSLKSSLQELETRRTDLLTKYQPTYPLVVEVEKQIGDLKTAIGAQSKDPVKQVSTAQNPTYLLLQSNLVTATTDKIGYAAKIQAMQPMVSTYKQQALLIDQKGIQRQDLLRNIKAAEENYMLYVQKQEQARISDALDSNRILNVTIAEEPSTPSFPVYSPVLLVIAGIVLAVMVSVAAAFVSDYVDPCFRTPQEVDAILDVPLVACFARSDNPPRFGLPPASSAAFPPALHGGAQEGSGTLWLPEQEA